LPSIHFGTDGQSLDMSALNNANFIVQGSRAGFTSLTHTLFVVYVNNQAGDGSIVEFYSSFEYLNANDGGTREVFFGGSSLQDPTSSPIPTAGSSEIVSATFDSSETNMYVNGANHGNYSYPLISSSGDGDFSVWCKEANVSEIIVFDHALKNEERQAVEAYLAKKYNIKVIKNTPADAPVI